MPSFRENWVLLVLIVDLYLKELQLLACDRDCPKWLRHLKDYLIIMSHVGRVKKNKSLNKYLNQSNHYTCLIFMRQNHKSTTNAEHSAPVKASLEIIRVRWADGPVLEVFTEAAMRIRIYNSAVTNLHPPATKWLTSVCSYV